MTKDILRETDEGFPCLLTGNDCNSSVKVLLNKNVKFFLEHALLDKYKDNK